MSSNTDTAYVGVPIVEHSGLSVIGGYILCSLGLKYILANSGLGTFSFCNSIFERVECLSCVWLVIVVCPKLINICISRCLALSQVGLVSNLK